MAAQSEVNFDVNVVIGIIDPNTEVWRQQWETRLPGQLVDTVVLLTGVSLGCLAIGLSLAWLTSAYRFPGSRWFGWLLVAPLAMPSYVLGFVTLSVVGFTGPVQGWWRDRFGTDAWFPPVRSLGGAIVVFSLVLYPYVFLLARAALRDQAGQAYQAARSLGAGPAEAARRIGVVGGQIQGPKNRRFGGLPLDEQGQTVTEIAVRARHFGT